jgi:hypothetical protein
MKNKLKAKYKWQYWDLLFEKAEEYKIDPICLASLVFVESSGSTTAMRYEPNFKWIYNPKVVAEKWNCSENMALLMQKTSWGLGQVMGSVAIDHGIYNIKPFNQPSILLIPKFGLDFACKHWVKFSKKYKNKEEIYASYNSGSVRRLKSGEFENAWAVVKFEKKFKEFTLSIQ